MSHILESLAPLVNLIFPWSPTVKSERKTQKFLERIGCVYHMNWPKRDKSSNGSSMCAYLIISFMFSICGLGVVCVYRLASILIGHRILDVNETKLGDALSAIASNAWPALVCAVPGIIGSYFVMIGMRSGVSTKGVCITSALLISLGGVSVSVSLSFLVYQYMLENSVGILLAIAPSILTGMALFIFLQLSAVSCFQQATVYNFVASGAIFGTFIGFMKTVELESFYGVDILQATPLLFGNAVVGTVFWAGSGAGCATCVARANSGMSKINHVSGAAMVVVMAAAFGCCIDYPTYNYVPLVESEIARIVMEGLLGLATCSQAIWLFIPLRVKVQQIEVEDDSLRFARSLMTPAASPSTSFVV